MNNYLTIWCQFNHFLLKLDHKPKSWEDRATLFGASLFERGIQSSTMKSYMSAIKNTLTDDNYPWNSDLLVLSMLTKACKTVNDGINTKLPIHKNLLELLLFEVERMYDSQPFLERMYKALFLIAYYSMFRIGELASGTHPVKAKDVHIVKNKNKLLFILYTSKLTTKE